MTMRCPKCGRFVEGNETLFSDISEGCKMLFKGASMVSGSLKNIPVVNIPGMLVSFGCHCISECIPEELMKYKCSCGYSWIKKIK